MWGGVGCGVWGSMVCGLGVLWCGVCDVVVWHAVMYGVCGVYGMVSIVCCV